jgi:hypothetical protein
MIQVTEYSDFFKIIKDNVKTTRDYIGGAITLDILVHASLPRRVSLAL